MSQYCGNCKHYKKNCGYGLYCGNEASETSGEISSPFDGEDCATHERLPHINNYELRWRMLAIIESAEINDFEQSKISVAFDGLNGGFEEMADSLAAAITQDKNNIENIKDEIARLKDREKAAEKRIELAKEDLKRIMLKAGKRAFKTALYDYSIRKNPPSVEILNESEIPGCFFNTPPPKPDKAVIRDTIKAGREVPGARLVQTESLRIS